MSVLALWYLAWSVASAGVYGLVLRRAIIRERSHHDRRSRAELYIAVALFMAAASTLAGTIITILQAGSVLRLGSSALALGAFLGCGIIILLELPRDREDGS